MEVMSVKAAAPVKAESVNNKQQAAKTEESSFADLVAKITNSENAANNQNQTTTNQDSDLTENKALELGLIKLLEEESSELGAQLISEMLVVNPLLVDSIVVENIDAINYIEKDMGVSLVTESLDIETMPKAEVLPEEKVSEKPLFEVVSQPKAEVVKSDDGKLLVEESKFNSLVKEASTKVSETKTQEEKPVLDIDELEKSVSKSKLLVNPFQQGNITATTEVEKTPTDNLKVESEMILDQATAGIKENLEIAKNEFVIKLKPEGLGEITVKMAEQGSKMVLSIVTSSEQTGRLLNSQLNILRESLRPYNAEVENVVTESADVSAYLSSGGDFGSFARHQMFQQQQEQNRGFSDDISFVEELSDDVVSEVLESGSALDVHI